jgi:uncharacterized protein YlxW (UPF0749 family)
MSNVYAEAIDSLQQLGKDVAYEPAPGALFYSQERAEKYQKRLGLEGKIKKLTIADLQKLAGAAAKAATPREAELQKEVAGLQAQIETLQSQLAATQESLALATARPNAAH